MSFQDICVWSVQDDINPFTSVKEIARGSCRLSMFDYRTLAGYTASIMSSKLSRKSCCSLSMVVCPPEVEVTSHSSSHKTFSQLDLLTHNHNGTRSPCLRCLQTDCSLAPASSCGCCSKLAVMEKGRKMLHSKALLIYETAAQTARLPATGHFISHTPLI